MSTKTPAEIALARYPLYMGEDYTIERIAYATCLREVAQPLRAENEEQARLLGAGGERELALIAENETLRKMVQVCVDAAALALPIVQDARKIEGIPADGKPSSLDRIAIHLIGSLAQAREQFNITPQEP